MINIPNLAPFHANHRQLNFVEDELIGKNMQLFHKHEYFSYINIAFYRQKLLPC